MIEPRILLTHKTIDLIIQRFVLQLAENHAGFANCALIGLQPRGVELSRRIRERMNEMYPGNACRYGELDITFYRDDVGRGEQILMPKLTSLNFSTAGLDIVIVDDVLYTGRSIRACLDALMDFGRPARVELLTLVDRRYNRELPIAPDYVGTTVDSRSTGEKVKVEWKAGDDKVWLLAKNE